MVDSSIGDQIASFVVRPELQETKYNLTVMVPFSGTYRQKSHLTDLDIGQLTLVGPGKKIILFGKMYDKEQTLIMTHPFVLNPEIEIGTREIRSVAFCPRSHYLRYEKSIAQIQKIGYTAKEVQYAQTTIVGDVVHRILSTILEGSRRLSSYSEDEIGNMIETELQVFELRVSIFQHLASKFLHADGIETIGDAWNRLVKECKQRIMNVLINKSLTNDLEALRPFISEYTFSGLAGIKGKVDLFSLKTRIPVEIKTGRKRRAHEHQLKVYLTALQENSYPNTPQFGFLLYTGYSRNGRITTAELEKLILDLKDFDQNIRDRNFALGLRNLSVQVPPPSVKDCLSDRCYYHRECTYYCGTERTWACDECPLENLCDYWKNPPKTEAIDFYNRLRLLLGIERNEIRLQNRLSTNLLGPDKSYSSQNVLHLGVGGLSAKQHDGKLLLQPQISEKVLPYFDVIPGDALIVKREDRREVRTILLSSDSRKMILKPQRLYDGFVKEDQKYFVFQRFEEGHWTRVYLRALDAVQRSRFRALRWNSCRISGEFLKQKLGEWDKLTRKIAEKALEPSCPADERGMDVSVIQIPYHPLQEWITILMAVSAAKEQRTVAITSTNLTDLTRVFEEIKEAAQEQGIDIALITHENIQPEFAFTHRSKHSVALGIKNCKIFLIHPRVLIWGLLDDLSLLASSFELTRKTTPFDLLISLHSERVLEPMGLLFLTKADKIIFLGDKYSQEYKVRSSEARKQGLSRSLFEKLCDLSKATTRMHMRLNEREIELYSSRFVTELIPYQSTYVTQINLPITKSLIPEIKEIFSLMDVDLIPLSGTGCVEFHSYEDSAYGERMIDEKCCLAVLEFPTLKEGPNLYVQLLPTRGTDILDLEQHMEPVLRAVQMNNWQRSFKKKEKKVVFAGFEFRSRIMCPDKTKKKGKTLVEILVQLETEEYQYLLLRNHREAKLIKKLMTTRFNDETIDDVAVTTLFPSQVTLLRHELSNFVQRGLEIELVSNLRQGQYKTLIVSTVCSNPQRVIHWPLNDNKALYSIFTSPREKLIVVGDEKTLETESIFKKLISV